MLTAPNADYANVNGVVIGGAYDGQLNDIDLKFGSKRRTSASTLLAG